MGKIITLIFLLISHISFAQWSNSYAFLGAGQSFYQGDLNATVLPSSHILNMSYKFGLGYNLHTRLGLTLHYSATNLNGSDYFVKDEAKNVRGLSFNSPLNEFGLNIKIRNLTGRESRVISYLFSGFNYFKFNPIVTLSQNSEINYSVEKGYATSGINIPFGFGFGWWFTGNIGLVWESSLHITYTDYLDGISKNGNPNFKDAFVDSHFMLLFKFSKWEGAGKKTQKRSKGWSPKKVGRIKCPSY